MQTGTEVPALARPTDAPQAAASEADASIVREHAGAEMPDLVQHDAAGCLYMAKQSCQGALEDSKGQENPVFNIHATPSSTAAKVTLSVSFPNQESACWTKPFKKCQWKSKNGCRALSYCEATRRSIQQI